MATTTDPTLDEPLRSYDDLLSVFRQAEKPFSEFRIGPEMEKPGVCGRTFEPIRYDGDRGVLAVLQYFIDQHGWQPERENEHGPIIALKRGRASITLEPGGQLELSGAAMDDVHQVCAEFRGHMRELKPISDKLEIRWLGVGFHPFARREDLPWVPKDRYKVMREYLPKRGEYALDMMQRTSTVQANYDFSSEQDAMRKMRVALALGPLTTALFSNSPWLEGKPHGGKSYRARVWLDVDNDRAGLVEPLWRPDAGYRHYAEWALDVPMFLVKRNGKIFANTGQTFRSFWQDGFEGLKPTQNDWQTHLNTLFPEVRLKKTIEVRGADAPSSRLACALPALWTGIFYDAKALDEAEALTRDWTYAEVSALRARIWKEGLQAMFRERPLSEWGLQVLSIAEGGLHRRDRKSASGKDESVHLVPLRELVAQGCTPADKLLDGLDPQAPDLRRQVVERTDLMLPR
ncbi:glutamate--cysteine ligase [Pendulispora rubella]|uniref:Glutamate--cysteine ligase n=1 Tax=Pendulispora rubella TaxID=2741070 RepID=A0ABZ2LKM9_9BACT